MKKKEDLFDDIEILDDDLDVKSKVNKKRKKKRQNKAAKNEEKKEEKESKGILKKTGIFFLVVFLVLAFIYGAGIWFFSEHFMFHTTVDGKDFSLKTTKEVEDYIVQQLEDYVLTIRESGGKVENIKGKDILLDFTSADQLQNLIDAQNQWLWPVSLWESRIIQAEVGVAFDEEKLSYVISGLDCMKEENQTKAKSAYPEYDGTQFVIVPEEKGTEIDSEKLKEVVSNAIHGLVDIINLEEEDCFVLPKYTAESAEVIALNDEVNGYLKSKVTYTFGEKTEVVDSQMIAKWIKIKKNNMKSSFDKKVIKAYVQSLASKYNTAYSTRKFTTARGDTVNVEGGSFGWILNKDEEYKQLIEDIKSGEEVTREAIWSAKGASLENGGIGNTYAEVDLTNQHMYFVKDGKVVLETDVVTGNPNKGNATPQGMYSVTYKQKDRILRGTKKPDGTYEYETPVKYWMPFNGGIGFHDASWQSSFGGDRYKTHGSHGCVNMPPQKAAELYDLIEAGMPVICYF